MRRMLRVGLTGNIGSGKSTAAGIFAQLGARIIDADMIAHELLLPGSVAYPGVIEAFGEGILQQDATIDRRKLGQIVFSAPEKLAVLNRLIHPHVRSEIRRRVEKLEQQEPHGIVIVDAALIVETGFYRWFDRVIVVGCDPEIQLARIVKRDGLSVEEVRARIATQMPAVEKEAVADYRIDASGSMEELRGQIAAVYRDLLREANTK